MGITDPHRKFDILELAKGDVMFAATGVTNGAMLRGVRRYGHGAITHSVVMRSKSGTVRYIEAHHNYAVNPCAQALLAGIVTRCAALSGRGGAGARRRPQPQRPPLDLAAGRGPRGPGHRPAPRRAGNRRPPAGGARRRAGGGGRFPRPHAARPAARPVACCATWTRAAARLADAVRRGETVAVFGDYDVDGACSGALMTGFLRGLGCTVLPHVPDRMTEGYGPNVPALQALAARGATLLVCVDCGTAAGEVLACLHGRADVVVLDHHKAEGPPPAVLATVNPNRLDCGSGLGMLCAAGIAFLTAVGTVRALRRAGFFAAPARARPAGPARPRGAGHGVRRDAADRAEPRASWPRA